MFRSPADQTARNLILNPKVKTRIFTIVLILGSLVGWCAMMALYFTAYDLIEQKAVPVSLPTKLFTTQSWDRGFFDASGAFENQSAVDPGDELLPQANSVTCVKQTNTCTVATASVFDHFLDIDTSRFDISSWTDQQITFADDSPICVTNSYIIDRAAQTITLLIRRRAVIPDYAAKSPLHPCDNVKDANIDLADGFKVHERAKAAFENRNDLYFHAALAAINILFFGAIVWLWRWRKTRAMSGSTIQDAAAAIG